MKNIDGFYREVRAMGVVADRGLISGEGVNADNVFIRFEDTTKAQEKKITKLARLCGLEIHISDKGALFQ